MNPSHSSKAPQRGEVLILALLVLLVLYLGFLYTMRGVMLDAKVAGSALGQQKAAQASDVAFRQIENLMYTAYGGQALEFTAVNQSWYRDVAVGTAGPDGDYWDTCINNASSTTATTRCGSVTVKIDSTSLPYTAYFVVQPTGRVDKYANCPSDKLSATYYDVFLYLTEAAGGSGVTTETVMKLCVF
jgi:Tfp pilus assembly protein PilX